MLVPESRVCWRLLGTRPHGKSGRARGNLFVFGILTEKRSRYAFGYRVQYAKAVSVRDHCVPFLYVSACVQLQALPRFRTFVWVDVRAC
jgi:hypothetical protein